LLKFKLLVVFIFSFQAFTSELTINKNLVINSISIEIMKDADEIFFKEKVNIDTGELLIKADSAIYSNLKKIITLSGNPSLINSKSKDKKFSGQASKIIFFDNNKIQLSGNATMNYDDLSISSNVIIFNPQNGKISSDE
jgi:lipopolysaccharide transport protein LptA|tara:strand:- start:170 stop:586 length:417 start_codon:yes stop_codon:yes gene_type:complete